MKKSQLQFLVSGTMFLICYKLFKDFRDRGLTQCSKSESWMLNFLEINAVQQTFGPWTKDF